MGKAIIAIGLLSEIVNSAIFTCWVQQILLSALIEKAVIVMDNATFHKGGDIQKIIANAGHTFLYLHPYSPDLNPIEKNGHKLNKYEKLPFTLSISSLQTISRNLFIML